MQKVKSSENLMLKEKSPCVSSEGEDSMEERLDKKAKLAKLYETNISHHAKKKSQMPNGSFIESKMKNCLQSRNAVIQEQSSSRQCLSKAISQPYLHSKATDLSRNTQVKTAIEPRAEKPSSAMAEMKPPSGQIRYRNIGDNMPDLKSLNLSPIMVPQ